MHYGWAAMCAWKAVRKPAESAAALSGFPVNMQGSLRTTLAGTAPNMTVPKPLYNPLMPSWPRMLRAVSRTPCTHQRLLLRRAQVEILTWLPEQVQHSSPRSLVVCQQWPSVSS